MTSEELLAAIRLIVREELERLEAGKVSPAAVRQKRYRQRLKERNESVTPLRNENITHNGSPSENVTPLRNANGEKRYAHNESVTKRNAVTPPSPLSPPQTPPLTPQPNVVVISSSSSSYEPYELMTPQKAEELALDPKYAEIDVALQTHYFKSWCINEKKEPTVWRFKRWLDYRIPNKNGPSQKNPSDRTY